MIQAIKELNFPPYATLSQATATMHDMGDRTITADIKIDGAITPDFSYDWEVEFKGDKYIQPLRKPQGSKGDKSLMSTINLTFYHWAIYQLKRYFFVELASTQAGTAFADKYIVPLSVNLGEFVVAFSNVLSYYFPDGDIYIDLNPDWVFDAERKYIDINNTYLWDVLQKTYGLFGVRWVMERDTNGKYAIRIGYHAGELTHIFEYGFEGGLLNIERQVQDANIRNKILGRGGSKNIPSLYFKDYDKYPQGGDGNQGMIPDPDAIPELANIYFSELRDSNFRSYVQGWKTNANRLLIEGDTLDGFDTDRAETDYAYMRGATDEKFDPVEYVKDDTSIAEYGELVGRLENNEDIYPSLQGMNIELTSLDGNTFVTKADEIVAVQEVTTDSVASDEAEVKSDIKLEAKSQTSHGAGSDTFTASAQTITVSSDEIEVPEGYEGTLFDVPTIKYTLEWKERIKQYMQYKAYSEGDKVSANTYKQGDNAFPSVSYKVIDVITNKEVTPINVPEGRYRVDYTLNFPSVTLGRGIIHAQQTPSGLGQTERLNVYWLKRNVTTSAAIICKSFNGDVILNKVDGVAISESVSVDANSRATISITGDTFSVPEQGAIMVDVPISITPAATTTYSEKTIKVVNANTNEIVPATNIPEGEYKLLVDVALINESSSAKTLKVELLPAYLYFADNTEKWQPTFDVWIKNVFNTKKSDYVSEAAYVEGVWSPLRTEDEMVLTFSSGNLSGHEGWEFKVKKGGIAYDNSRVIVDANGNEVRSEWRLTLIKSDAELETIKKYIPYKDFNAKAGDTFFFTGIILPHQYVLSAEKDVTSWKEDNLTEVKDIKPQWVISLDKVRAHREDADRLIDLLHVGAVLTLKDQRFTKNVDERQILQSITFEWQETSLLPSLNVVLSDKVTTSLSTTAMLQGKVDALARQVGGLSNLEQIIRKVGDLLYLRKDGFEDTSFSPTRFADIVSSENFKPGAIGGSGWGAYTDENGNSVIEADKLFIRNEMQVNSLIVNQIAALGGTKILSAADMTISAVEPVALDDGSVGERCFFDTKGSSKSNLFAVDDIAYSDVFDSENVELKYYKRRIIEVGVDYITLSTTDKDGEGSPQVGDVVVQFGNFTDTARQSFIIIDPLNGGKIEVYAGVNSFDIRDRNMVGLGVDSQTKEAFLYGYGNLFFGDREKLSSYIFFDKANGKFKINADVTIGSDSSGLENFSEWSDKQSQIDTANTNASKAINDAKTAQDTANTADAATKVLEQQITDVETGLKKDIGEINQKLDGVVESYFDDYTPSRTNLPASEWIANGTEADHIGDTFTNTATEGDDAGKSWRWLEQEDGTYDWQQIADSDAARALVLAGQAQVAADGKNTTFLVKPNKAYKKGDMWIIGSNYIPTGYKQGDILTANKDNESYVSSDWSKLVRYIGDDALSATREELEEAIENAEKAAKDYTDKGKAALQDSIDTLEQTKASVESVDAITKSDGLISAAEQRAIAAAEAAADAAQKAAETKANAYADGEIKKAEQEAIDTANANLEAAKAELNESIARLDEETADAMDAAEAAATKAEAAQSEAATATETSNAAKDIAGAAKGLAEAADSNASQAVNSAEEANTKALAAEGIAQQAQKLADSAKTLVDTANANAASAAKDASDAKEEASVASGKLSNWASDLVISPFEKQGVKDEYAFVVADKEDIDKQIAKYNVEDNTFGTTYNIYKSDLETIVNATTESVAIPTGMSTHQSEYYSARTTILEAISTAAKKVADDAQSAADTAQETADNAQIAANNAQKDAEAAQRTANEAKAAADAAKLVTDNLNNDLVFSLTEKRSIRSKLKDINPSETQAIRVNTFMLGAVESKGSGSWSKVTDEADANYGWYASNMHTDSSYAIAKVNLVNVVEGSSVTVHIMSRAESTYDYTMLGAIDTELSSPTDTTTGVVAHTRGKQGQDISYTFTNLKEGSHFFCVYYRKDSSTSTSPDNGYFKIDDALFLKGSLGDYLALCKEKGISGSDAITKATSLFAYLYNKGVWDNTDTVLSESDDFRNRVYGLFQDYYAAITGIQQEITKSDYEYLTEAFGKSKNLNVEGVVMSQLMAVRNEEGEVEAFMNGSKYAGKTSTKLIIAAGIPETASDGSKDLEDRAKEANTQLWENGRFKTTDAEIEGEIKASTGKIGPLHISEKGLSMLDWPDDLQVGETCPLIALHVDALSFSVMKLTSSTSGTSVNNVSIPLSNTLSFGLRVTRDNNHMNRNYAAIEAVCNGGNGIGNLAFRALSGMFSGLRPKTRVITTAKTSASPNVLDEFDYSVFVNLTSGTCYIDLPKNPQDGQEYYIESRGATMNIKVYQQCYSLYSGSTTSAGNSVSQQNRALLRFKYYAEASLWTCSWLNRNS